LLVIPYLIGLIWSALHPLVSIVTGELKCRGIYIDENGLDVHRHRVESYPVGRLKTSDRRLGASDSPGVASGICDALKIWKVGGASIECLRHRPTDEIEFDVVKISPSIGPVVQSTEAIVLVVNDASSTEDWYTDSDLNASILHLIQRLGSKKDCPWLAKTVFVVSGVVRGLKGKIIMADQDRSSMLLNNLVDAFLSSYSGKRATHDTSSLVTSLPPHFTYPLIRSVLVLSNIPAPSSQQTTEVRILPHGTRGTLPNLDLVFATVLSFQSRDKSGYQSRSMIFYGDSEFRVHPFPEVEIGLVNSMQRLWDAISGDRIEKALGRQGGKMKKACMQYAKDLGGLLGFMGASMLGRAAPHYPALERGIDALTIELRVPLKPPTKVATSTPLIHSHIADTARVTEHLLRAISNLHERLHHSVNQYTLPSMTKFVSHGEYIFPAILVSLPMVGRAAMLALRDITRFRFVFVGVVTGVVSLVTLCLYIWSGFHHDEIDDASMVDWNAISVYSVAYLLVVVAARRTLRMEVGKWFKHSPEDDELIILDEHHKSLRFIACLFGVYLHAPLLLANYSLGFPSSTFWSPSLAIILLLPSNQAKTSLWLQLLITIGKLAFLLATCPPVFLVPTIFGTYTTYVKLVYTPLHLILVALWLAV
jgi:glycosylphosphatidylinositol transamidase